MSAGGGASSSKAGGLNDGARRMCMGRGWREEFAVGIPPLRCAVGGRGRVGRSRKGSWLLMLLFAAFRAFMAG
jgi:hypothetical protein